MKTCSLSPRLLLLGVFFTTPSAVFADGSGGHPQKGWNSESESQLRTNKAGSASSSPPLSGSLVSKTVKEQQQRISDSSSSNPSSAATGGTGGLLSLLQTRIALNRAPDGADPSSSAPVDEGILLGRLVIFSAALLMGLVTLIRFAWEAHWSKSTRTTTRRGTQQQRRSEKQQRGQQQHQQQRGASARNTGHSRSSSCPWSFLASLASKVRTDVLLVFGSSAVLAGIQACGGFAGGGMMMMSSSSGSSSNCAAAVPASATSVTLTGGPGDAATECGSEGPPAGAGWSVEIGVVALFVGVLLFAPKARGFREETVASPESKKKEPCETTKKSGGEKEPEPEASPESTRERSPKKENAGSRQGGDEQDDEQSTTVEESTDDDEWWERECPELSSSDEDWFRKGQKKKVPGFGFSDDDDDDEDDGDLDSSTKANRPRAKKWALELNFQVTNEEKGRRRWAFEVSDDEDEDEEDEEDEREKNPGARKLGNAFKGHVVLPSRVESAAVVPPSTSVPGFGLIRDYDDLDSPAPGSPQTSGSERSSPSPLPRRPKNFRASGARQASRGLPAGSSNGGNSKCRASKVEGLKAMLECES